MAQEHQTRPQAELARSIGWGVAFGVSVALAFSAGFIVRDWVGISVFAAASPGESSSDYALVDEVQALLDTNYLREQPTYAERQYGAVRGMLNTLDDRYTFFVDPPVAQSESDVLAGTYGGVGVQIQRSEAGELVMYPFADSPAEEAGIVEGDILLAIDDESVDFQMRQDVLDQMLRGEVKRNSGVDITYARGEEVNTTFVPFGVINVPSVVWRLLPEDERIGYVQVLRFTNRTPGEVEEALDELLDMDAEALVLDLRNNSGGLLQESVDVAGHFLDGGIIVYEENLDGGREFTASDGAIAEDLPMVVLVNGGTASAAELVAGAIRDRGRGILVGQRTFGKGTVQQIFRLSDESSVHITSAEWFTPARNEISGVGLEPDIVMIPDENGRDVELGEAIRYLSEGLTEREAL